MNDLAKPVNRPAYLAPVVEDDSFETPPVLSTPRISLKGGRMTIVGIEEPIELGTTAEMIFVGAQKAMLKMYFAEAYKDTDELVLPDCWSEDGIVPSPSIVEPQSMQCNTCPKNRWGSKISAKGSKAKACSDHKKLVVMVPGKPGFYEFRIPPASLQGWQKYVELTKTAPLQALVTQVKYGMDFVLSFKAVRWISEKEHAIIQDGKKEIQEILSRSFSSEGNAPIASRTPVPLIEEEVIAPAPEPAPKVSKRKTDKPVMPAPPETSPIPEPVASPESEEDFFKMMEEI